MPKLTAVCCTAITGTGGGCTITETDKVFVALFGSLLEILIFPENSPSVELGNVIVTVCKPLGDRVNIEGSNVKPGTSLSIPVISRGAVPVFVIVIVC